VSERLTIAEVNALDRAGFVARFGGVFEGEPWMVTAAWPARPFADRAALARALTEAISRAPASRQLDLIQAHPDLGGRAALAGTLTRASTGEQQAAGLDPGRLTAEEVERFAALNEAYRARFGFPFVICARENQKEQILAGFAARLTHRREQEIATALAEIGKIGHYRLVDLVEE